MKRMFYKRYGLIPRCQQLVEVSCVDCGAKAQKQRTQIPGWGGRCRPCANKRSKSQSESRKRQSEASRVQVLRQGGIPNAVKFTKGSTAREKNWKWIKDRSLVKTKRTMVEFKTWRKSVYERDNYTCVLCGKRGGKLNADHIKPYRLFPELGLDVSNGRTLCEGCHRKTPTYGVKGLKLTKRDYAELIV